MEGVMHNNIRIQKASRRLRFILLWVIFLMPVINALVWIFINRFPEMMYSKMLPYFVAVPLPVST